MQTVLNPEKWNKLIHKNADSLLIKGRSGSLSAWRVSIFLFALLALAGLIGYAEHLAWRQMRYSLEKQRAVNPDRFNLGRRLEAKILEMNESLLRFQSNGWPADRYSFQQKGQEIQSLLAAHQDQLTPAETSLLNDFSKAFGQYGDELQGLLKRRTLPAFAESPTKIYNLIEAQAAPVLALARQLEPVQQAAFGHWLNQSKGTTQELQLILLAWSALLPLAGLWILHLVYRRTVSPLRSKLAESQLIIGRQEKLASLGIFAAGVAHEIRNPLMAMKVHLFSLAKQVAPASSAGEKVSIIGKEINRLDRIVNDFLQFARPAEPVLEQFRVDELLQEISDLLKTKCEHNQVDLRLATKGAPLANADRAQIKQVLLNLVNNALESVHPQGIVILRAHPETEVLQGRPRPVVCLEVQDTGSGIPEKVQERLFDPFFTTKPQGTGLGLSIAMRIVEKHGGAIRYRTHPERGTTFTVILPQASLS